MTTTIRRRRLLLGGRIAAGIAAAFCWLLLALVAAVRLTVLNYHFDARALDRTNAYERVYTDVLPDPAVAKVTTKLLAGLPLPPTVVTGNVRLVLPPSTLRIVIQQELRVVTDYLLGRRADLNLLAGLEPVIANVEQTATQVVQNVVAGQQERPVASVSAFRNSMRSFFDNLIAGQVPHTLPVLALGQDVAGAVKDFVLEGLPATERYRLGPQVTAQLAAGNIAGALATVAPAYFGGAFITNVELRQQVAQAVQTLRQPAARLHNRPAVRALAQTRTIVSLGTGQALALLLAAYLLLVGVTLALTRKLGRRVEMTLVVTLLGSSALAAVGGILLAKGLTDPLHQLSHISTLPQSVSQLVNDIDNQITNGVRRTYVELALPPALLGAAVVAVPHVVRAIRWSSRQPLWHWHRAEAGTVVVTAAVAVSAFYLVPSSHTAPLLCNGSAALCDRAYNAVTYLAAHNAMASTEAGFLGADQGPDIVGQLNYGVRDLMVDTHYWTSPSEVRFYIQRLPAATQQLFGPLVNGLSATRPGVWLCHDVCQLGALNATTAFRHVRDWLHENPHEVLTVDIEDHTTVPDTKQAVLDAGLRPFLFTPPDDPNAQWPTLRQMIKSGHRLVVFSERHDDPGGWFRNLFRYAAETPWEQTSVHGLSCSPGRGPTYGAMFLINHYVTGVVPDRRDAAILNSPANILATVRRCREERRMAPVFVAVNFVTSGNPLGAIDLLNGISRGH